jgi:hypothetical protein
MQSSIGFSHWAFIIQGGKMKAKLTFLSIVTVLISIVLMTGIGLAEVNDVQSPACPSCPPNHTPSISMSDTSVFLCSSGDSVKIRLLVTDPDAGDYIKLEKILGMGTFITKNQRAPLSTFFSFRPDTNGVYAFVFRATDQYGATDQDTVHVTVTYNLPPQLTCPNTQNNHINGTYTVSQVIADDFDGTITSLNAFFTGTGISNLSLINIQGLGTGQATANIRYDVVNHCAAGAFVYIIGTDNCGAADTCFFGINLSNTAPAIICPSNDSVLAGATFISTNFSATDPDNDVPTVTVLSISPSVVHQPTIVASHVNWVTTCSEKGTYTIRLQATDPCGYKDTCEFTVNVYNQPPVLTCPNNGSVHAGSKFVSSNFSSSDPVTFLDITPPAAHNPYKSGSHIEWQTTCAEKDTYTIRLVATGNCGAKDTCEFKVYVYNQPPVLTCPANDSVNAGDKFYSTDYSVSDPDDPTGVTVSIQSISPTPSYNPTLVGKHVEWRTKCADLINGPVFTITLVASDPCGAKDTCQFTVTVYNLPPVITCPQDDSVRAKNKFVSTDFSTSDPKCENITVTLCGIDPSPVHQPYITFHHVEWQTACEDAGKTFTICLEATDSCGSKDTCYFHVRVYNYPPVITCPEDDSVRAGIKFVSTDFSASDPKCEDITVTLCGIDPSPVHQPIIKFHHVEWQTACEDAGKTFTICLEATDNCGAKDTCYFQVTVYNQPPVLTCPDDDSVHAGGKIISTDYSVTDPEGDSVAVTFLDIDPSATNLPVMVEQHVEWATTCAENGDYTISLVAADSCGAKDTCEFTVTVYNQPPVLTCPDDDSVHAGGKIISTDYSVTDPEGDSVTVTFLKIDPSATNLPVMVNHHVEWITTCAEKGDYSIFLVAEDSCGAKDTCDFTVTVYNQPPVLTCPESDSINAGDQFLSTDFSVTDPEGDSVTVIIKSVSPTPTNAPTIVGQHIEWLTCCADLVIGPDFTFTLIASDSCGAADTCQFTVTVYNLPPVITCPENDSMHAGGNFVSTDFSTTDPKSEPITVNLCGITPTPVNQPTIVSQHVEWQTACGDTGRTFTICLVAEDSCGAKDTCYFDVTVYNRPPQLTCPNDGIINATQTFISSDFSVIDLDGDLDSVTFLDIAPPATNDPTIVGNHVEWVTTIYEYGDYIIRLVATDSCGLKDTCQFKVTVYNEGTNVLDCPEDDSVHTGVYFTSTNFSVTGPGANPDSVRIISITPTPAHQPVKVEYHVEWQTECSDSGKVFTICLEANDDLGLGDYDTCCFYVTVYNRPPQLICPNNDTTFAGGTFISTDFSASDIDGDSVTVSILSVSPSPAHNPTIVENHVEWVTDCEERGDHTIRLVVSDPCGLKDTCQFVVTVVCSPPPSLVCPENGHVNAGLNFVSTDFDVITSNGGPVNVELLDINPTPHGKLPVIIGDHVEWMTNLLDEGDYFIRLLASDNCGNKDTCQFKVNIFNCHNPNFDITISPDTQFIIAGQTAGYGVKLTRYFNLDKPCTLTVSGLPHPASGVFDRARFTPTDSTTLNIFTSPSTDTGKFVLTLRAWTLCGPQADYVEHEVTFLLRVLHPIDAGDDNDNPNTPSGFALYQNQPNPFNPETKINYYLPKPCNVKLTIYNVLGQTVKTLQQGYQSAGLNTVTWDGRGKDGAQLSSGIYFYRLEADKFVQTKKMSLMK